MSIIEHLQKVMGLIDGKRVAQPVIEEEKLDTGQGMKEFGIGAVDVGNGEVMEETRRTVVAH